MAPVSANIILIHGFSQIHKNDHRKIYNRILYYTRGILSAFGCYYLWGVFFFKNALHNFRKRNYLQVACISCYPILDIKNPFISIVEVRRATSWRDIGEGKLIGYLKPEKWIILKIQKKFFKRKFVISVDDPDAVINLISSKRQKKGPG